MINSDYGFSFSLKIIQILYTTKIIRFEKYNNMLTLNGYAANHAFCLFMAMLQLELYDLNVRHEINDHDLNL